MHTTIKSIFDAMPDVFQQEAATDMTVSILFDITGEGGGKWLVSIDDGALTIAETEHAEPNLTLTVSAKDYLDISNKTLNSQLAFMTGRLKATGDMRLAMKMPKLFKE